MVHYSLPHWASGSHHYWSWTGWFWTPALFLTSSLSLYWNDQSHTDNRWFMKHHYTVYSTVRVYKAKNSPRIHIWIILLKNNVGEDSQSYRGSCLKVESRQLNFCLGRTFHRLSSICKDDKTFYLNRRSPVDMAQLSDSRITNKSIKLKSYYTPGLFFFFSFSICRLEMLKASSAKLCQVCSAFSSVSQSGAGTISWWPITAPSLGTQDSIRL